MTAAGATRTVAVVWDQHAPYHADRLAALAARLGESWTVTGIALAAASRKYAWTAPSAGAGYHATTLFAGPAEGVRGLRRLLGLARATRGHGQVFLCNYERPTTWLLAVWLRARGARIWLMFDSTRADKPRRRGRERLKRIALAPYHGGLVSGRASRAYLHALGLRARPIATGYDTLSVARVRDEADAPPAPDGVPFDARAFLIVARCVPEKNLAAALDAYAEYAHAAHGNGRAPRALWLCGDGPDRPALERWAGALGLTRCRFLGFRQPAEVARLLAHALALVLPSRSEPWGLVANEALALGVPVLVSNRAGCAHDLVRDGVNGRVLGPDQPGAWAEALTALDRDPDLWKRLAAGARDTAAEGDVRHFAAGAAELMDTAGPA